MGRVITSEYRAHGASLERAVILDGERTPEGLGVERIRLSAAAEIELGSARAHLVSPLSGELVLVVGSDELTLTPTRHAFVPVGAGATLRGGSGSEVLMVSGERARGRELCVRDEQFVCACAEEGRALRWILTPQYLSRRLFLHHDPILLSRAGDPVSWFRTTMFDTRGLPPNREGESVFKMSYDSRTEFNVCYDVRGEARVRFAHHPYRPEHQRWTGWHPLTNDTTYHLDEARGGPEEEVSREEGKSKTLRNRHEVFADGGHVTLFCLFDPAPTGVERHRPGEYSDYEPIDRIPADALAAQASSLARFDGMLNELSLAAARGRLAEREGSDAWRVFERGRATQREIEAALLTSLDPARRSAVAPFSNGT